LRFLATNITNLSSANINKAKKWVIYSIICVFIAQSGLTLILFQSLNFPTAFSQKTIEAEKGILSLSKNIENKLNDIIDFGQDPTEKKSSNLNTFMGFNLFLEKIKIEIPLLSTFILLIFNNFLYKNDYNLIFINKIIHPPRNF